MKDNKDITHTYCVDNRFELITKYRERLIKATNIEHSSDEMKVLDTILFRFWQMGWLNKIELSDKFIETIMKSSKGFMECGISDLLPKEEA